MPKPPKKTTGPTILIPRSKRALPKETGAVEPPRRPLPVVENPLLAKQRISRKGMPGYVRDILIAYCPALMRESLQTLLESANSGSLDAAKKVMEIFGVTKNKDGTVINVLQNNLQQTALADPLSKGERISRDAFIRKLAERRGATVELPPAKAMVIDAGRD